MGGIEGKTPEDQKEEDWGGTIEFGCEDKKFPPEVEDYFYKFQSSKRMKNWPEGKTKNIGKKLNSKDKTYVHLEVFKFVAFYFTKV